MSGDFRKTSLLKEEKDEGKLPVQSCLIFNKQRDSRSSDFFTCYANILQYEHRGCHPQVLAQGGGEQEKGRRNIKC